MELDFQKDALFQIKSLAEKDSHSILISGMRGNGKTYLAKKFAEYKGISTFNSVNPRVAELKDLIDSSYRLQEDQVICIENLDSGKSAASQVILKYLEEPLPNVYVVVTCVNPSKLPDTILSRSISVQLAIPKINELQQYARNLNAQRYTAYKDYAIFSVCKSLSDVRIVLNLSLEQIKYYDKFSNINEIFKQPSDSISWMLVHYDDNSKSNVSLVLRCIMKNSNDIRISSLALDSLLALEEGKISESAIIGRFVLNTKVIK